MYISVETLGDELTTVEATKAVVREREENAYTHQISNEEWERRESAFE